MTALQIIRIPMLPFGMLNAYLLLGPKSCVLVDAGLPDSEAKIAAALRQHGRAFTDITLIVLTHAHIDHAGNAARLRAHSGAPIVAHAHDAPYFRRDAPMTFCPTGWFGRLFLKTALMVAPYPGFEPDILLGAGDMLDLQPYGLAGQVTHTPGHTAGSLSITLAPNAALVGDLLASGILLGGLVRTGHAKRPPFEDDPYAVGGALQQLLDSGIERFYMGHGGPLPAREVQRHVHTLMTISPPDRGHMVR
jgi:hydroxyacylglutathione hydrolase